MGNYGATGQRRADARPACLTTALASGCGARACGRPAGRKKKHDETPSTAGDRSRRKHCSRGQSSLRGRSRGCGQSSLQIAARLSRRRNCGCGEGSLQITARNEDAITGRGFGQIAPCRKQSRSYGRRYELLCPCPLRLLRVRPREVQHRGALHYRLRLLRALELRGARRQSRNRRGDQL